MMTDRLVSTKEVCFLIGNKSRVTLWRWVKAGLCPKPKKIGPNGNCNGWLESDLNDFFNDPEKWVKRHKVTA